MLETLGIVQLPTTHTPHSNTKYPFRRLGGRSVLERIVRRATEAQRLDGVIAVSGVGSAANEIASAIPADIPLYQAQAPDALARAVEAIEQYPCRAVVFLSIDTPFVDPALIDQLVITAQAHSECDYVGYRQADGRPSVMSEVGVFAEWCTARAVKEAHRKAKDASERMSATQFIYSHPERFQLRFMSAPQELDRDDLRLRVTCEEDWEHADMIAEAIGEDAMDWQCVARLLENQPGMREQMARLNKMTETIDG